MKNKWILILLVLGMAINVGILGAGEPVTFTVTGDYPYGANEIPILEQHIYEHNLYSPSEFFVHVGDLFDQVASCEEQSYEVVASRLKGLEVPAFVVIGDNDWTDCSNRDQAFAWWFERFNHYEENFCTPWEVERQSVRPENWAFVLKGVLFIGINYPGSSGGTMQDDADWVDFQFQEKRQQVRAAVVFGHRGPNPANLNLFFGGLVASSSTFTKPVIYIQGHDHRWQLDKYGDLDAEGNPTEESAWLAPNMQRLIVDNGGDEDPVQITVTMDPNNPFEFLRNPWDNNPPIVNRAPCSGFDFLADKKFKTDKPGNSRGFVHSNDKIEIKKGLPSNYSGNMTAVKDIKIEEKNTINGNVTAGGKLDINSGATINGTATAYAAVTAREMPVVSFGAGGAEVKLSDNEVRDLAPGSYDKVEVGKRGTLRLRSGEYFFKKLNMKDDATLSVDVSGGKTMINVVEEVDFHKGARVDIADSRNLTLQQVKDKDMVFDDDSRFWGSIVAPLAKVKLEKNAEFKGSIVAKEIEVKENATVSPHSGSLAPTKMSVPPITEGETGVQTPGKGEATASIPSGFGLSQNYPNPFNPETQISFQLPEVTHVVMSIYNVRGQEVLRLLDRTYGAGTHTVRWDGKDNHGNLVPSGIYFYRIQAGEFLQVKKMNLLK